MLGGRSAEHDGPDVGWGGSPTTTAGGSFDSRRRDRTAVHAPVSRAVDAATADGRLEAWGDGTAIPNFLHVDDDDAAAVTAVLRHGPAPSERWRSDLPWGSCCWWRC